MTGSRWQNITAISSLQQSTRGGTGRILRFSFGPGSAPESKFFEKLDPHPKSLFNLGSSRSLRDHFLIKTRADVRCINRYPESEQEFDSQL